MEIALFCVLGVIFIFQIVLVLKIKKLNKKTSIILGNLNYLEGHDDNDGESSSNLLFEATEKYHDSVLKKIDDLDEKIEEIGDTLSDYREEMNETMEKIDELVEEKLGETTE